MGKLIVEETVQVATAEKQVDISIKNDLSRTFSSLITETAYPVISDEDVESMTVLAPPLPQQKAIADSYEREISDFSARLNEAQSSLRRLSNPLRKQF